jgi:hypothetical protein
MGYTTNGSTYDFNSIRNQDIKSNLVRRDVFANVTMMVSYILEQDDYRNAPFTYEDIENLYAHVCPECDSDYGFKEIAGLQCLECEALFESGDPCKCELDDADSDNFDEIAIYKCRNCDHIVEDADALDTRPQEIYEWYLVDRGLAAQLKERGECVIEHADIWGRQACGQAILLDGIISEIAHDMQILEGQQYEWRIA